MTKSVNIDVFFVFFFATVFLYSMNKTSRDKLGRIRFLVCKYCDLLILRKGLLQPMFCAMVVHFTVTNGIGKDSLSSYRLVSDFRLVKSYQFSICFRVLDCGRESVTTARVGFCWLL